MSTRSLRLVAPFRCQFNLDSAKMVEEGENFNVFLQSLNTDFRTARERCFPNVPQGIMVEALLRPDDKSAESRYISLEQAGSHFNSPKQFSVGFDEKLRPDIAKYMQDAAHEADKVCGKVLSNVLSPMLETLDIAIYEKTIAILTLDLAIDDRFNDSDWAMLDEWTTRLVFFFLNPIYRKYIFPTFRGINEYAQSRGEKRIRSPREYYLLFDLSDEKGNADRTRLLWVNRTLVCPKGEALNDWATRHMDATRTIDVNGAHAHMSWGNNIIETTNAERPAAFSGVWDGLYLAQYYYAVLDVVSKNLKRFICATYDKKQNRELRALSRAMDYVINSVTVIEVDYKDFPMELQGVPKAVFRRLEKEWDFSTLLLNVRGKRDLCKSHGELLTAYINQRNSIRVEMVLTGVAGVGLVGLMMNLSSYGRALKREGYTNDVVGLLDIGQHLSPSVMIWIGLFLAVAISIFVSMNRTR
ncbi:MAG: hypothetical protein V4568_16185 [Pseudomonadota bacterium]